jgi:Restriction endonuclease BglII
MRVVGEYSFAGGKEVVNDRFSDQLQEIYSCIENIDLEKFKTKVSEEKSMYGKMLYSPTDLNKQFKKLLGPSGWKSHREKCDYPNYYVNGYSHQASKGAFRDMDFVKDSLGVEVQFGKYSFMVYNVAAKMTIFRNLGVIEAGIEIVPVKELALQMSSGVSYFEQFTWDLENRGVSNIDTPVLILGIL